MTLVYLVAAWVAGILVAQSAEPGAGSWLAVGMAFALLAAAFRVERALRLALALIAVFALGAARQAWHQRPPGANHISHYTDSGFVTVIGTISRTPEIRETFVNLTVEVESLTVRAGSMPLQGCVLAQAPRYGDYAFGDRVRVAGSLVTPPEFDTFSYRDYLARRGVYAIVPNARVELLARRQGSPWRQALFELRDDARATLDRLLPSPEAPLLSGILLGLDDELPANTQEDFSRTGTAHIIAISGSNLIIIMKVVLSLLTPLLGIRRARLATVASVVIYAVFVGGDPAVVRAAIMGGLALFAAQTGRKAHGITSLAFAAWLMSLHNPAILWDAGFQLSAVATAGLVLFGDSFIRALEAGLRLLLPGGTARKVTGWLAEPVAISLAAQVAITPLALIYFGTLSPAALLANALVVSVQPYIMIFGWLTLVTGLIAEPLGSILAWSVWLPLAYTLAVVRWLAGFSWASVSFSAPTEAVWSFYLALAAVGWLRLLHPEDRAALLASLRRRLKTGMALLAAGAVCVVVWYVALTQPDGKLHVWFLDTGQGHSVLIQSPRGAQILVDGGRNPSRLRQAIGDALPAWDRALDLVIVTQPAPDAIGALPALLAHYDVGLLASNGHAPSNGLSEALTERVASRGIRTLILTAGQQILTDDGLLIEVLYPQQPPAPDDDPDDVALALRLSFGQATFLVAPGLSAEAVGELLDSGEYLGSAVVLLPARGSERANPAEFLTAVRPQVAVVMVGTGNRTALPATQTVKRLEAAGARLYRTDRHGTVEVVTDGHTLTIYPEGE
ncbi:MAG: ComEC/Rec2 family competence protein [Anaerolineae bacterium]|nr:ComEC/Rec2 family competence protein [Anaerolineae bacterium]